MKDVTYRSVSLSKDTKQAVVMLMKHYGLRFAAIDMAISLRDEWFFFEVNPNGQWAWLDLAGVTDIAASFVTAFQTS
jgi:hypothetical protein